eukprot:g799.t1
MISSNEEQIERFVLETQVSRETARSLLQLSQGNYERALAQYYEMAAQNGARIANNALRQNEAPVVHGHQRGLLRGAFRFVTGILLLPIGVLKATLNICRFVIRHSLSTTAQLLLPSSVQAHYVATNGTPNLQLQATDFITLFQRRYGAQHPNFVTLGWKEAAREAENQSKFLFAYLHSPEHEDSDEFCRSVLTSNEVIDFLNQHFISWGGSIDRSPAFTLAANLRVTTFPCVCILSYTDSETTAITSIQGTVSGTQLLSILQETLDNQGAVMMERRAERQQRETDRQIRADQDLEYQRALEADRERDRRNQEAAAIAAAQEEARRQELAQEQLARELELQQKQNREQSIRDRRSLKLSTLVAEPEANQGVVQIRVRLPDGSIHNRRFLSSSKISEIYDYVDSLESLVCWDYILVCSYPRFEFTNETKSQSLHDLGIDHSIVLLVQSLDD